MDRENTGRPVEIAARCDGPSRGGPGSAACARVLGRRARYHLLRFSRRRGRFTAAAL